MVNVYAIIPARGGSKGIPHKNIRALNGITLIKRTIDAALQSKLIDRVSVSSDSEEILNIAKSFGANAILRPDEISGDSASSEASILHAIEVVGASDQDIILMLQCTSPFTTSGDIDAVIQNMIDKNADSAFSACADHGFIWRVSDEGEAAGVGHDHTKPRQRRQDMEARYLETGAIYAMRAGAFKSEENRFCGNTILVEVNTLGDEIDTIEDWERGEALAKIYDRKVSSDLDLNLIRAVITDFDGVHTDDRVLVSESGSETVICSRSDGMGIEFLRKHHLKLLILSREQNRVVVERAKKLKMDVLHHIEDKLPTLDKWRIENELEWNEIAFIGNDVNDLECMRTCGVSFAPQDAHPLALEAADIILTKLGGKGAIRELSEILLQRR